MRRAALLLAALLLLNGCTPKKAQPDTTSPPPPPAVDTAEPGPPEPAKQPPGPADQEALRQKVGALLEQQGLRMDVGRPGLYDLHLSPVPEGFTRLVGAVADMKLFLVALNDETGSAKVVAEIAGVMAHPVMVEIGGSGETITIFSYNLLGDTMEAEVRWDGKGLSRLSVKGENAAAAYFGARQKLIDGGDVDGLMLLGSVKDMIYPQANPLFWSQPKQILLLAYAESLERYRAGDLAGALQTLQFGVQQYSVPYGGLLEPTQPGPGQPKENLLTVAERIPIANDLAFFLSESGKHSEALPLLQRVIEAAPDRAVAYLNLADVEWELGQRAEAKGHYQRYLDLLGPDKAQVPDRVRERLDS